MLGILAIARQIRILYFSPKWLNIEEIEYSILNSPYFHIFNQTKDLILK